MRSATAAITRRANPAIESLIDSILIERLFGGENRTSSLIAPSRRVMQQCVAISSIFQSARKGERRHFSVETELVNAQSSIEYFSLEKRARYTSRRTWKRGHGNAGTVVGTKGWPVTSKPACRVWLDVCRIQSKCM